MSPHQTWLPTSQPPEWTWAKLPRRYVIAILAFVGFFYVYVLRVNMSIAIVAMTANTTVQDSNGTITYVKEFDWNSKEQGLVLSSFFYGYITSQILGGYLATRIGAARLFGSAILVTAIMTLLTPVLAYQGIWPLVFVRAAQGVCQGVVFPAMHELWSHWAPPLERTKLMTISHSGNQIGTFMTMAICGLLAEFLGWPSIFYTFGSSALLWCVIWFYCVRENPSVDRNISPEELNYIVNSIGPIQRVKFFHAPWRSILTSKPIWAAMTAHMVQNCGFYTFLTQLPTFLNDVSGWNLGKTGIVAAVPYLIMAVVLQFAGQLADLLRSRFEIRTTLVRKAFTSGCYIIQMTFLLITAHVYYSVPAAVSCLTIAVAAGGFASYSVNYLDLAPQFASLGYGVSNTLATLPGMISPSITGLIVQNKEAAEWQIVFYITAGVYLYGAIFYAIFASGERQPWAL